MLPPLHGNANGLREAVERALPDECWVLRSGASGPVCTDMIGGGLPNGAKWVEEMCCVPCRVRLALATSTAGRSEVLREAADLLHVHRFDHRKDAGDVGGPDSFYRGVQWCRDYLRALAASEAAPTAGEEATITMPAHHLVGMDLGFTCTNCGGHTSTTAPCIPARDYRED